MTERHYWDACCWLDFFNEGGDATRPLTMLWAGLGKSYELVISPIVLSETLIKKPGASKPWPDPAPEDTIFDNPDLFMAQTTRRVGECARSLRRSYLRKTGDALHLATCVVYNIDVLVTTDGSDLLKLSDVKRADGKLLRIEKPGALLGGPLFGDAYPSQF